MSAYSGIYTDMGSLARLRNQAEQNPEAQLDEVAGQFEALFTRMMLKTMREANLGDSLFDSNQNKQYLEMFDNQVAVEMSRGRGLGLKDMLMRQLSGAPESAGRPALTASPETKPLTNHQISAADQPQRPPRQINELSKAGLTNFKPASPEEFVAQLLPMAKKIEQDLGISHRAVLAQAALESGWGKHTLKRADGSDAFNLFGIKADASWSGDRVSMRTVEVRDGIANRESASFRAYDSPVESMKDYADFIKENPRYRKAIEVGADAEAYAEALHQAGYATDPDYASKISQILDATPIAGTNSAAAMPLLNQI